MLKTPLEDALNDHSNLTHLHCLPFTRKIFKDLSKKIYSYPETTSTERNLGSLQARTGAIKLSQELAATYVKADHVYFNTNGTSLFNRIIHQAVLNTGDIVFCDHGCHKSHHNGFISSDILVDYLQPYPIDEYQLFGVIGLPTIIEKIKAYKDKGLDKKIKAIILTHGTYDGLYYDLEKYMSEILTLLPKVVFIIDEAWMSFAPFHHHYKKDTAMAVARRLQAKRPRPDAVIRVYAPTSDHKGLPVARQGTSCHIIDELFNKSAFEESYQGLSTTSWNLPLLCSIANGRKIARENGEELIENGLKTARYLKSELAKVGFRALNESDLIPEIHKAYVKLDPSKITVYLGENFDGEVFKKICSYLGIIFNKVTKNTATIMCVMGTEKQDIDTFISAIKKAVKWNHKAKSRLPFRDTIAHDKIPSLPKFSQFHAIYAGEIKGSGRIRQAYYDARDESKTEFLSLTEVLENVKSGAVLVAAGIFVSYPPGQAILVYGQVISIESAEYLLAIFNSGREIHGYDHKKGLKVFRNDFITKNHAIAQIAL